MVAATSTESDIAAQHCKPKTLTRTRTVTKFYTTPSRTTTAASRSGSVSTKVITVTKSAAKVTVTKSVKVTVTKDGLKTVTMSQDVPSVRANKIVQVAGFLGEGGVCDLATGQPKNVSDAGYNLLLSKGDLMGNTCSNIQLSLIPGAPQPLFMWSVLVKQLGSR